jgi:hypothetical protein
MTNPAEHMTHCASVVQNMMGSIVVVVIVVVIVAVKVVSIVVDDIQ